MYGAQMESQKQQGDILIGRGIALLGVTVAIAFMTWQMLRRARVARQNPKFSRAQKIVILGAGFAGRYVALELARLLPKREHGEIRLIDQNNFLLFTPMLTEAAGGELEARHVTCPVHHLPSRITFEHGRVEKIDLAAKLVTLNVAPEEVGGGTAARTLSADHLVIALGSVPEFHDIPGASEHSLPMKTLEDAMALHGHCVKLLERANAEPNKSERRALLTVVVGGGGFTGVETMAAINDLLRQAAARFASICVEDIHTILIEPGNRLLPSQVKSSPYALENSNSTKLKCC